ncbi:MAG: Gfo/Idh/MocA family oxidoreductase, partial [Planctomycetota bacterium]
MTQQTRRRFLAQSAAATAAVAGMGISPRMAKAESANDKLNLAIIGCGGKGWHNVEQLRHENVAILCDIDTEKLDFAAKQFPKARKYRDYRKMYDAEANNFDAVVVSTADHTHAPATAIGLDLGKHAYCEKPLTHTVQEARVISKLAEKNKLVTQMGTQIHAGNNYRRVVEIVKSGALGNISDAYVWCNKSWGGGRYKKTNDPCPAKLDWDLFLGPAPDRPYSPGVHPGNWRRFWDYGSGTFGDMACHIMDLGF